MRPVFGLSLVALLVGVFPTAQQPATAGSYSFPNNGPFSLGRGTESVVQSIKIRFTSGISKILRDVHEDQILQVDKPLSGLPPASGAAPK